jgi:hypothetical protein
MSVKESLPKLFPGVIRTGLVVEKLPTESFKEARIRASSCLRAKRRARGIAPIVDTPAKALQEAWNHAASDKQEADARL